MNVTIHQVVLRTQIVWTRLDHFRANAKLVSGKMAPYVKVNLKNTLLEIFLRKNFAVNRLNKKLYSNRFISIIITFLLTIIGEGFMSSVLPRLR